MASTGDESVSFGQFARKQPHYGTSSKAISLKPMYLKHVVQHDDTIQGIAVKYGVTVEHIKQVNKLWTSDSLFLRKTVDIPIAVDGEICNPSLDSGLTNKITNILSSDTFGESPRQSQRSLFANPRCSSSDIPDSASDAGTCPGKTDMNNVDIANYFSKYDTVLDKAKNEVRHVELRQKQLNQ